MTIGGDQALGQASAWSLIRINGHVLIFQWDGWLSALRDFVLHDYQSFEKSLNELDDYWHFILHEFQPFYESPDELDDCRHFRTSSHANYNLFTNLPMSWTTLDTSGLRLFHICYPSTVLNQQLGMLPKCSLDQTIRVHFETSDFKTSGLRLVVGGETLEVKLSEWHNLLTLLDDVAHAEWLPRVTQIHDLHVPEMLISYWRLSSSDYAMCPWWHQCWWRRLSIWVLCVLTL